METQTFADLDDVILIKLEALHAKMLDPGIVAVSPNDPSASDASITSAITLMNNIEHSYADVATTVNTLTQHGCTKAARRLGELITEVRGLRAAYEQMQSRAVTRKIELIRAQMAADDRNTQIEIDKMQADMQTKEYAAHMGAIMDMRAAIDATTARLIARP